MRKSRADNKKAKDKGATPTGAAPSLGSEPLANDRWEAFCHEYAATKNQTRAYLSQYPEATYLSAANSAHDLLKKPEVSARVTYLSRQRLEQIKMTADEVLAHLAQAARLDPLELFDAEGGMLDLRKIPPAVRMCIERIEHEDVFLGEGENRRKIGRTSKIHFISKKSMLELLAKHHKLVSDRLEVKHTVTLEDIVAGKAPEGGDK